MTTRQLSRTSATSPTGVLHSVTVEHVDGRTGSVTTACGVKADPKTWTRGGYRGDPAVERRCRRCFPS